MARNVGAIGPAAICGAALAVPLCYAPNLISVFAEPKLALLYVAGALGIAGQLLAWAWAWAWTRAPLVSPAVDHGDTLPRPSHAVSAAVAAWLALTVIAACVAWARARGTRGAPYAGLEIGRQLAVIGVALAAAQAMRDPRWRRRLLTSIHAAAGLVSIIGLLQHWQLLPLAIPVISVPGSTFGNRNIAAEAVAMALPFGLGLLALRRPGASPAAHDESPVPILLLLAVQIVYLGATRTRGAWLGAGAGGAVFFALRRRALPRAAWAVAGALAVAALASAVIPGRMIPRDVMDTKRFESGEHVVREALDPASPVVRARLGLWRRTLAMYRGHPWLGVGPGNFVVFFPRYAEPGATADGVMTPETVPRRAHQDLLERLAETGPLGLASLLAVYGAALAIAIRRARRADQPDQAAQAAQAAMAAAAAGALVALFACGLTGFPLAMPATALLFGVALGVLGGAGGAGDQRHEARAANQAQDAVPSASPVMIAPRAGVASRRRLVAAGLMATVIVAGAAVASARIVIRSYWLARAQTALRAAKPGPGGGAAAALLALDALGRAERIDPGRFQVALETAFVLLRLGRFGAARAAVDRALAVEPNSPNAWWLAAEAELGAASDARSAADVTQHAAQHAAQHALALLNDYPDALATLARAEARLGDVAAERAARDRIAALAAAGNGRARRLIDTGGPQPGGAR